MIEQLRKETMAGDSGVMGGVCHVEVVLQPHETVLEMESITFISVWRY